jgi:predicted esterase
MERFSCVVLLQTLFNVSRHSQIPSEAKRLSELLRRAGADVTIRFTKAGHGLTNDDLEAACHWLAALNKSTREKL